MMGSLAERCPADILSEILRRQISGILTLRHESTSRQLFLDAGANVRFAASNHPEESLISWLVKNGGLTQEQIRQATGIKEPQDLLGTVLVRLGHLTRAGLNEMTESHVRRVLGGALAMSKGHWDFQQGALPFREQLDAGVRTAEALLEWTRTLADAEWIRRRLGPSDTRVHRDRRPPEGYQSIRLDPVEGYIMSRVDGAATIREICMVSPMGDEKALAALLGLALAGILEMPPGSGGAANPIVFEAPRAVAPVPPPPVSTTHSSAPPPSVAATRIAPAPPAPPAVAGAAAAPRPATPPGRPKPVLRPGQKPGMRPTGQTRPGAPPPRPRPVPPPAAVAAPHSTRGSTADLENEMLQRHADLYSQDLYQVLGVGHTAPTDEVRHAYYELARRFHPDKFRDEAMKAKAEQVFGRITEAYSTLSVHEARSRYDGERASRDTSRPGDKSSDTGSLARENFRRGKEELERGRFAEALAFLMNACEQDPSRAEYFEYLGATQAKNPRLRRQAEESLLRSIALSPTSAGAYLQLAALYERSGAADKARDMYKKALEWDPENEAARRALGPEPTARKGILGLFSRK